MRTVPFTKVMNIKPITLLSNSLGKILLKPWKIWRIFFLIFHIIHIVKPRQHAYRTLRAIKLQKVRGVVIYCKYLKIRV